MTIRKKKQKQTEMCSTPSEKIAESWQNIALYTPLIRLFGRISLPHTREHVGGGFFLFFVAFRRFLSDDRWLMFPGQMTIDRFIFLPKTIVKEKRLLLYECILHTLFHKRPPPPPHTHTRVKRADGRTAIITIKVSSGEKMELILVYYETLLSG